MSTTPLPQDSSAAAHPSDRRRGSAPWVAFALDAALVVLFVALGQREHATDRGGLALVTAAAPFLLAWVAGTALAGGPRTWARVWPQGVVVWAVTVAAGMGLRVLWGLGGAPVPFVLVASAVLAVFLLGRRWASTLLAHRATDRASRAS